MNGVIAGELVEWWFAVAMWAVVLAALARTLQLAVGDVGPRWIPVVAGMLAFVPIGGLPIGRWLHGFNANFSIPFLAVLLDHAMTPLSGRRFFDDAARRVAVWYGVVAGVLLYPAALGWGPFDPYELGWRSPGVAAVAALVGAALAFKGSRFGIVLLVAGGLWQIGCLESDNAWDYLIDPIYCLTSIVNLLGGWLVARQVGRSRSLGLNAVAG